MYGYLRLPACSTDDDDRDLYRAHFCSGCHALEGFGSRITSLLASYDLNVATIVLAGLEGTSAIESRPCVALPFRTVSTVNISEVGRRQIAALAVALADAKLRDDVADGDGRRWLRSALSSRVARARTELREAGFPVIEFDRLGHTQQLLERRPRVPSSLGDPTARLLGQVFVHLGRIAGREELAPELEAIGRALGRGVYWLDALDDRAKDRRVGRFNPLLLFPDVSGEAVRAELARAASRLPELDLGPQEPLLRAILGRLSRRLQGPWATPGDVPPDRVREAGALDCCEAAACCECGDAAGGCCSCVDCCFCTSSDRKSRRRKKKESTGA